MLNKEKEARMYARESDGKVELFFYDSHGRARVFWSGDQESAPVLAPVPVSDRVTPGEMKHLLENAGLRDMSLGIPPAATAQEALTEIAQETPPTPPLPRTRPKYELKELLKAADPTPAPFFAVTENTFVETDNDVARRRAAKKMIREAAAEINRVTSDQSLKYELALLVMNGNIDALQDLQPLAAAHGLSASDMANQIVEERESRRSRAGEVLGIEARALKLIDTKSGDDIEATANDAVLEIREREE
jgi:hypothetical protein